MEVVIHEPQTLTLNHPSPPFMNPLLCTILCPAPEMWNTSPRDVEPQPSRCRTPAPPDVERQPPRCRTPAPGI